MLKYYRNGTALIPERFWGFRVVTSTEQEDRLIHEGWRQIQLSPTEEQRTRPGIEQCWGDVSDNFNTHSQGE